MKARKDNQGFTLIELLVVISIIGILAGMLIPVLSKAKLKAQVAKARTEIKGLEGAISQYYRNYSRLPTSQRVRKDGVTTANPDYTYGTALTMPQGGLEYKPKGSQTGITIPRTPQYSNGIMTNNSEVMGILMDVKAWEGVDARKKGNAENRQGIVFLNVNTVEGKVSPGVGTDGVYRDPWGSPYIITLDLNYDGGTRDALYRGDKVNENPTAPADKKNITGLFRAMKDAYEVKGDVMVWSLGPDRMADYDKLANVAPNKDNVLGWAQ